jgi:hypothetical protein
MNQRTVAVFGLLISGVVCMPWICSRRPGKKTHETNVTHTVDAGRVRFPKLKRLDLRCRPVDLGDLIEVEWSSHHGDKLRVHRDGCIEGNITAEEPVQDGCADAASIRDFITALRRIAPAPPQESEPPLESGLVHATWEFVQWTTVHGRYTWQIPDNHHEQWEQQIRPVHLGIDAARHRLLTVNTPHAVNARRHIEARPAVASASFRWSESVDMGGGSGFHYSSQQHMMLRADGVFFTSQRSSRGPGEDLAGLVDPASARRFVTFLHARGWDNASVQHSDDGMFHMPDTDESPRNNEDIAALWRETMPVERCGIHP